MTVKDKNKISGLNSILIFAVAGCLLYGCEVNAIEQSSTNGNTTATVNKSQRLNFAASNSISNNSNNATNDNANGAANTETNSAASVEVKGAANAELSETPAVSSPKKNSTNSQFVFAAAQNLILARNLAWTFGGKIQTGWYIYKPLICHTIGAAIEASDNDFAEALARWQAANELAPNGVLDNITLAVFVNKWQSNRLKIRGYAAPNELIVAPIVDFYDVSRPDELRQVQRDTYVAYKKLLAAAIADKSLDLNNKGSDELAASEKFLKIVSAFRSRDYQEKLRRESPNSGRAGLAVNNSPHFTGRALDVYVGGEPVITKDENRAVQVNTKIYQWLVKNAGKFGFKPYFYEPWHWEYAPD